MSGAPQIIGITNKKTENCMVCGHELEYLKHPVKVTCDFCKKKDSSHIICPDEHYVCNECHAADALKVIRQLCLTTDSDNPMEMAFTLMNHPIMPMHGPEHHGMIAGVIVAAYKNATGKLDDSDIEEAIGRGAKLPGGFCGLYGADAAGVSTGVALSVITGATPMSDVEKSIANVMTARSLLAIANNRGPRCCKRSTMTAIETATQYLREVLGAELGYIPAAKLKCGHSHRNKQCVGVKCRFFERVKKAGNG